MTISKKRLPFLLFPLSLLFLSLMFPSACMDGVKKGSAIAFQTALPALFPAMVLSRMILLSLRGKGAFSAPLILGLLCGFPIGASTVAKLVSTKAISKKDGEKMLFFCNGAGPSFLIGICGKTLLGNAFYGWFLFLFQAFLAILFFFLLFRKKVPNKEMKQTPRRSLQSIVKESLSDAVSSFIYISACIIFFSFFLSLLCRVFSLSRNLEIFLSLFLELTSGVSNLELLPQTTAFPLCAAAVGFGGCSVHLQTLGVIENEKLNPSLYFLGKMIFACFLFFAAEILQKCL